MCGMRLTKNRSRNKLYMHVHNSFICKSMYKNERKVENVGENSVQSELIFFFSFIHAVRNLGRCSKKYTMRSNWQPKNHWASSIEFKNQNFSENSFEVIATNENEKNCICVCSLGLRISRNWISAFETNINLSKLFSDFYNWFFHSLWTPKVHSFDSFFLQHFHNAISCRKKSLVRSLALNFNVSYVRLS